MEIQPLLVDFTDPRCSEVALVGGKNASLSRLFREMRQMGVQAVDGFAITSHAFREFLEASRLTTLIAETFAIDCKPEDLSGKAKLIRDAILKAELASTLAGAITAAYRELARRTGIDSVAVRSSGTAEDLEGASFAGQHETYLNVSGDDRVLQAVKACFASLYTDRAVDYRFRKGFGQTDVALSVGVQPMIRSDQASSGVMFTLDPDSGFKNVVVVTGSVGYGEFVVQGSVTPDEWVIFKPTLGKSPCPIVDRRLGSKERMLIASERGTEERKTPDTLRTKFCLQDDEVIKLAAWACLIEDRYSAIAGKPVPMDLEWAKDGPTGELFIIQARPETVHAVKKNPTTVSYRLTKTPSAPLVTGLAIGERIAVGRVRVVESATSLASVQTGDVLVAETTEPDWEPVMKKVAAIVTDEGGRTAHAAIVSRELGVACVVGSGNATQTLTDGQFVTVSCAEGAEGHVYEGELEFTVEESSVTELPHTRTKMMVNVADPAKAFSIAESPNDGVGLARMEFIITNAIRVHPLALARYDQIDAQARKQIDEVLQGENPKEFFVRKLSEGIARIAAAFYPNPVIVRTSDFKTNEYAQLVGGGSFEPDEENPMLGFRGASRYYDDRYRDGFALECEALLRARREMGLANIKVMIPFCRTVAEGQKVIDEMARNGLVQGQEGLELYVMCEIPSNVVLADQFLDVFDGFSIGSNDLTQLILGVDRDSGTVAHLFDERNDAVKTMIAQVIAVARKKGKPIGICGQAPSDYPDFAAWLVTQGITSISLNPDTLIKTRRVVAEAESALLNVQQRIN